MSGQWVKVSLPVASFRYKHMTMAPSFPAISSGYQQRIACSISLRFKDAGLDEWKLQDKGYEASILLSRLGCVLN
jgi:hypothetical protein